MNPYLIILIFLLAIACTWLVLRYSQQNKKLNDLEKTITQAAASKTPSENLPADLPGLEDLSNAIRTLAEKLEADRSEYEIEQQKLAAVLERMTDGVIIANSDGIVTLINPAAERFFNAENCNDHTLTEVMRHHQLVEAWQRSRKSGQPEEESIEVPGNRNFLHLIILPDQESGDSLLLVQDLTRLRRMEKVRQDFISNVSHELRTPLASLKALAETLRDGAMNDSEAAPRFLERIETEVDALSQMTQELLNLTRIESGQVELELKEISPEKLLTTVVDRMSMQAERAGIALVADAKPDLPDIQADRVRLEQVLVNLVHNAIKFTPAGGRIILNASHDDENIHFSVADTGAGIPLDDLERVFERFYKSDRARSGGGTGLGLSIARHIIEAHRGHIWVESIEGQGSTFFFTIPIN